ncbi:methyltransferase domain-containing protein [Streptomyces sp. NPDC012450]|uniref:class I SAM-dependent methyltransferase n=1 Tax=Streptomyces sp. NPDC012450 TaxID=3364834 RepID=UPI0036E8533C
MDKARERWPDAAGTELHQGDALAYLGETSTVFDAVFSVFGVAWFTDPGALLPAVHANLKPGGVFAFSQRPPVEGCYGCQASYIPRGPDEDPAIVKRWDYEPEIWCSLLKEYGFPEPTATVLPAPERDTRTTGTLLVRAVRGDRAQPVRVGKDLHAAVQVDVPADEKRGNRGRAGHSAGSRPGPQPPQDQ